MAKTNWQMDETVMPSDLNQMGQEINNAQENIDAHSKLVNNPHKTTTEQINKIDAKLVGDLPALYPVGVSVFSLSSTLATPWKTAIGHIGEGDTALVETSKVSGDYIIVQKITFNNATTGITGIYERTSNANNSWKSAWVKVVARSEFDFLSAQLADNAKGIGIKAPANVSEISLYFAGDSTSDIALGYSTTNSPTVSMYVRMDQAWIAPGQPLQDARRFVFAKSGQTLLDFIDNVNAGAGINDLINRANQASETGRFKVVIFSLGHNGSPTDDNYSTRLSEMRIAMNRILNETDAQVLLRMPNCWVETEAVTAASSIERSNFLNRLYKQVAGEFPKTRLLDVQSVLGRGAYAQDAWKTSETVAVGAFRFVADRSSSSIGGQVYKATTSGTTGATQPSGTGTAINDGGVTWSYVGALNPYMGDHIHLNKLGYEVIADLIGKSITSMVAELNINTYKTAYLGKPSGAFYASDAVPVETPIISGNLLQQPSNRIIIDVDFDRAKTLLQVNDVIKPYGATGKRILITENIERPLLRQSSTAYVSGQIVATYDQYGLPITLECVLAGNTGASSSVTLQSDQRNTYILDGSVRWMLLARYHMTMLTYDVTTLAKGTLVEIYRPQPSSKSIVTPVIAAGNYVKLATARFYTAWSEIDLNFNIMVNADTVATTATVDISLQQNGAWSAGDLVTRAIVSPRLVTAASTSLIKNDDIVIVTTALSTNYREIEIYLKNSSNGTRRYAIQAIAASNKNQLLDGSEKPHVDLLPVREAFISVLPASAAGTTNVLGQYNNAFYLARADGALVKLTVDNTNAISVTLVQ